ALYNTGMAATAGGITRSGVSGSYAYSTIAGRENMPVGWVSWYDAVRFANWMNNGQGSADSETGAYTLLGGTEIPSNAPVGRNVGATIVLTSDDEWYKAAYYSAATQSYFDFATGSDVPPTCSAPTVAANMANCGLVVHDFTKVGSYTGSA